MKEYTTELIRNVGLVGHSGSGKTVLAEALLYHLKYTDRLGRATEGNTVSDYDPEEIRRQISISTTVLPVEYKGYKINFLDIPGYRDFIGEIKNAVRVCDALIIALDATSGVEVGTEFVWDYAHEYDLPVVFFVNKMDKERANFDKALQSIRDAFATELALIALPIGQEASFTGVIDLLRMKVIREQDGKATIENLSGDLKSRAEEARTKLVEIAAEGDDELTMKFLEDQPLSDEEVLRGLRQGLKERKFAAVLCGSVYNTQGVASLLDLVISCLPAPNERKGFVAYKLPEEKEVDKPCDPNAPFSAFVFKTVSDPYVGRLTFFKVITGELRSDTAMYNSTRSAEERMSHVLCVRGKKQENVHRLFAGDIGAAAKLNVTMTNDTLCDPAAPVRYAETALPPRATSMALMAKSKTDEEKIGMAMHRLIDQDPTLHLRRDSEIRQTIMSGMGDIHLEVAVSRLKTGANVDLELVLPRVPYRETITRAAKGQGKYKRQSGGRGQYGDVWLKLEPKERGSGFEFEWEIVGGVIPSKYQPSIEKGLIDSMERGILAGYPVVDIRAIAYDGTYHSVDSSDIAFKIAGSMAFRNVAAQADAIILEPIVNVKVTIPDQYMGDIMGNLSGKRGRILGNEVVGKKIIVQAQVPLAEMFNYSKELRSMTQGRGVFEMVFSHYEPVPRTLQEKIIAETEARKTAEEQ